MQMMQKTTDEVPMDNKKWTHMEQAVLSVSARTGNKVSETIFKAAAFSNRPAMVDGSETKYSTDTQGSS